MEEFKRQCIARDFTSAMTIFLSLSLRMKKRAARCIVADGNRAIHLLVERCSGDVVVELVKYGRIKDIPNSLGQTPIMIAARHNNLDALKLLVSIGAARCSAPGECNKYRLIVKLITYVIENDLCDVMRLLLEDLHFPVDFFGSRFTYRLVCRGSNELIDIVLDHFEQRSKCYKRKRILLTEAIDMRAYECIRSVLDRDVGELCDTFQGFPFDYVRGDVKTTRLLIDRLHWSPLLVASACRCPSEVMRIAQSTLYHEDWMNTFRKVAYLSDYECFEIVFFLFYNEIRNVMLRDIYTRSPKIKQRFHVSFIDQVKGPYPIPSFTTGTIPSLKSIAHHHIIKLSYLF